MTYRRFVIAAGAMLLAVLLKLTMPEFDGTVAPALKDMICEEQVVLVVPKAASEWLGLD